jgi:hypothetical protein
MIPAGRVEERQRIMLGGIHRCDAMRHWLLGLYESRSWTLFFTAGDIFVLSLLFILRLDNYRLSIRAQWEALAVYLD